MSRLLKPLSRTHAFLFRICFFPNFFTDFLPDFF